MGKASTNTTGTLAGQDAPLVSRRALVKDRKIVVRNRRMVTTDDADCCCGEGGCDPYPKCVSYEHGPAASGGGLKKCGLMLPSNGGADRVRASCHIRGRRPDYNAGGAATDIVRYWLHSSTLPQITDWPRPMCPQWVASAADGCLQLTEFTEKAVLTIVYRDGTTAGVDVIAHAFTDGKRWKVTCTPDGNGELYTEPNGVRTVTDTRVFTSLDFDGGTDGGYCEGTLAEVAHTSRLVISGIDPAAFTDDAKYWVVVAVPPDTELPSSPDATCRKPQSVQCFADPAKSFPTVVRWSIVGGESCTRSAEGYSVNTSNGQLYLSSRETYSGTTSLSARGRECMLDFCFGILIPNSLCSRTCENAINEPTYSMQQTGRETYWRADGSVIDDRILDGTSKAFFDPANCAEQTGFQFKLIEHLCSLNNAARLNGRQFSNVPIGFVLNTGYISGSNVAAIRFAQQPGSGPSGSSFSQNANVNQILTWSTTLGANFIESRISWYRNDTTSPAGFVRESYTSWFRVTIEPDPLACPPAGGVIGIPPRESAMAILDAYFRGK